jgi:RNA recognition motif-containing protein
MRCKQNGTKCRNKETGDSRGFAFLAYEDQRSTNLAVDNLNGFAIDGRIIAVDHVKDYRRLVDNPDAVHVATLAGGVSASAAKQSASTEEYVEQDLPTADSRGPHSSSRGMQKFLNYCVACSQS